MKKFTQEEFDNFEVINGRKQCPTGDYTDIKVFGDKCKFGDGCDFGKWCKFRDECDFGRWCKFKSITYNDIEMQNTKAISIFGIGESQSIYRWLGVNNVNYYQVGCFFGNEKDFREAIKNKYGDNHVYFDAIDFINKIPVTGE